MSQSEQTVIITESSARRVGRATGEEISDEFDKLTREIRNLREANLELKNEVTELGNRIERIETTKARAERSALEEFRSKLRSKYEEKRQEFDKRVAKVLEDYRSSVSSLKDRFVDRMSGRNEQFEQIEEEFDDVIERRNDCRHGPSKVREAVHSVHEARVEELLTARNEFFSAIDSFVEDREQTAETINSIQTNVPGISGTAQVVVPFWVYGIRSNGSEEIRVRPILERGEASGNPTRAEPYSAYLRPSQEHPYGDLTDIVREHVINDDVRDSLARQDGTFARPDFLAAEGKAMDRFVDALERYELRDRSTTSQRGRKPERDRGKKTEVTADD